MTIKKKQHNPKIVLDLTGPQGNAFVVLGTIQRLMKTMKFHPAQIKAIMNEMTSSDYEHLVATADKHFGKYIDFLR